mgnify:CR=1 FL=1
MALRYTLTPATPLQCNYCTWPFSRLRLVILFTLLALPASAETPRVVADIAPVQSLLAQVMAGVAEPALLMDGSANPHDMQLRPSQARLLARADLVVWIGPALSPWLASALDGLSHADQIILLDAPAAEGHLDHDHHGFDPHIWLSPENARDWLTLFADTLAARDPDNAATYRANAAAAEAALDDLDAALATRLAPFAGAEIVTLHDAFGHFTEHFGIHIAGSLRASDATAPSVKATAALKALVAEHGVTCAFAEPGFDTGLLTAIASETGLKTGTLDATGALQAPGPGHYAATLTAIADEIARCLGG